MAVAVCFGLAAAGGTALTRSAAAGAPTWFSDSVVISGLDAPTSVRFAPDGRVFVAQKGGQILAYDSLDDTTPTLVADLAAEVNDYWDRGLLGFAVDPGFPARPYLYALFTVDRRVGTTGGGPWGDTCPTPPGGTTDGCPVNGRIARLAVGGFPLAVTASKKLVDGEWCTQFPSHTVGDLRFGPDGALYASGGEGSSAFMVDYGQAGGSPGSPTIANPCGDPPGGSGHALAPPSSEGGALRAQSLRRPAGERRLLSGTIIRIDPETGAGLADNPRGSSADPNERRVIAFGLRNPYRFTFRPDPVDPDTSSDELWVADVGWDAWEEVDRVEHSTSSLPNFGWPCYEGAGVQPAYVRRGLLACDALIGEGSAVAPVFAYAHGEPVSAGDTCLSPPDGSNVPFGNAAGSITGLAFYAGGSYPAAYDGGLFFADYGRNCIWLMRRGADGLPDPARIETFITGAEAPVDLERGPGGDLFYVSITEGAIHRISADAPSALATTSGPAAGPLPLTVAYDGSRSSAPAGHDLVYAWDLDGDGSFDDSVAIAPTVTYDTPGAFDVRLRVTDELTGLARVSTPIRVVPGGSIPTLEVTAPSAGLEWRVGDEIAFAASGEDGQDGELPASAFRVDVVMRHCDPSGAACHSHRIEAFHGVRAGSFSAPDHDYPSHLELRVSATDSSGLEASKTVVLEPATVDIELQTAPSGLQLSAGPLSRATPFTTRVVAGSSVALEAPSQQILDGKTYAFVSWSDGGARAHIVEADASAGYTAAYAEAPSGGAGGGGGAGSPETTPAEPAETGGPLTPPTAAKPVVSGIAVRPRRPVTGKRFTLTATVTPGATVAASVTVGGRAVATTRSLVAGRLRLTLVVPRSTRGKLVRIGLRARNSGGVTQRSLSYRVG